MWLIWNEISIDIRDVGVTWLFFLIKPLYVIGVSFGEDQETNIITTHVSKMLDYDYRLC